MPQIKRVFAVTCFLAIFGCFEQPEDANSLLGLLGGGNTVSDQLTGTPVPESDTTKPYVHSSSPYNNANHVPLNASINLQFTKDVDASTIQVNTAGNACDGSIRLSRDGFQTCVAFQNPNPDGLPTIKSLSLKPVADLDSDSTYAFRISNDVKDPTGTPFFAPFYMTFKTQNVADDSFTVDCPQKLSRSEFLSIGPTNFKIDCSVKPYSESRVIREVLIVPRFVKLDGVTLTPTKYDNLTDKTFTYYNDSTSKKDFTLKGPKFTPSFDEAGTWAQNAYLSMGVHIHYKDGDNVSTKIDIMLDHDVPETNGFYYNVTAVVLIDSFVTGAGELPRNEWKTWVFARYADGSQTISAKRYVTNGMNFIKMDLVVRPHYDPPERLYVAVDSTGDGVADYVWSVPNYDVAGNGTKLLIFAVGERINDENSILPVTFTVTPG